jgi:hypothetical protein
MPKRIPVPAFDRYPELDERILICAKLIDRGREQLDNGTLIADELRTVALEVKELRLVEKSLRTSLRTWKR